MTREMPLPEKRKPLTRLEFAKLALEQDGMCGCGCGHKLDFDTPRAITDEHEIALDHLGSNDLSNRSLWRSVCSREKTKIDLSASAKGKRIRGEKGQQARRQRNGSQFQSKGFQKAPSGYVSPLSRQHPSYKKPSFPKRGFAAQ